MIWPLSVVPKFKKALKHWHWLQLNLDISYHKPKHENHINSLTLQAFDFSTSAYHGDLHFFNYSLYEWPASQVKGHSNKIL